MPSNDDANLRREENGPVVRDIEWPVVVLSDLHLGHPASYLTDPAGILPLLGNARTVIFNGDTFENVHLTRRVQGRRLAQQLLALCANRGVRPYLITGNHDPQASSWHRLDLFGGKVLLTHGDMLHPFIAPWARDARSIRTERLRLSGNDRPRRLLDAELQLIKQCSLVASLFDHEVAKGDHLLARLAYIGRFAWKPWRIMLALAYWASVARYSRQVRDRYRPDIKLMLIGHTHRAGVWQQRDFTLVNTGSFLPLSVPMVVEMSPERADVYQTVHRARRGHGNAHWERGRLLHHVPLVPPTDE